MCASAWDCGAVDHGFSSQSGFEPFIVDARASLVGGECVDIKVLRDTGGTPVHCEVSAFFFSRYPVW